MIERASYVAQGDCLLWKPWLVALHSLADLLMAVSFFAISVVIWIFAEKRQDLELKHLGLLFAAFLFLCGMTHLSELATVWAPVYGIEGLLKAATAAVAVAAAVSIFPMLPAVLAIPSPRQMQQANWRLALEVASHRETLDKLEQANRDLEARVAERTEQLERARKLEALGWLTGGVAHDFNNLLAIILGNMHLLEKRLDSDDKASRLIRNAIEGAERGARLTQMMLAFACRRDDAPPGAVDVAELTRVLIAVLRESFGPAVRIETDFPEDLWPARTDPNSLEMALLSLAVNGRDAMPGGGALTLSARNDHLAEAFEDLAPGDYVRIVITDTGAGMDQATVMRAAEPFFTTKDAGKGAGLGLSMVQDFAARSGGALRLSSSLGEGTTVKLWLPRAAEQAGEEPTAPRSAETGSPAKRTCTALVVDDDALTCMATADMLTDLGCRVIEASSGYRALEVLRSAEPVDIVVADHATPGMTGVRLAREIRAAWPALPVLIVSGFAEIGDTDDLNLPRLDKPYDQKTLGAAIEDLLRTSSGSE
jgi:signal transduction histidine kinase